MDDERRQIPLGRVLIALGTVGLIFSFVGQGFVGEGAAGLFLPAMILLFIGRAANRRASRQPIESLGRSSQQTEKPKPAREQRPAPRPQPKPEAPSRAKVDAELEKTLAAYRPATQSEPMVDEDAVVPDVDEFRPKSSAEMIEEARRRFNKTE